MKTQYVYVFERDYKGNFRVVKIKETEGKTLNIKLFKSEAEAWAYLSKNPPIDSYS